MNRPKDSTGGHPSATETHEPLASLLRMATIASAAAAEADEALQVALRWEASRREEDNLDDDRVWAIHSRDDLKQGFALEAVEDYGDRTDAIGATLPYAKASSLPGAAVQILAAVKIIDDFAALLPDSDKPHGFDRHVRALNRLLFSAMGAVDSLADRSLADLVPSLVMPSLDPWKSVDERIEEFGHEVRRRNYVPRPEGAKTG